MIAILSAVKQYLNLIIGISAVVAGFFIASLWYGSKLDKLSNEYSSYKSQTEKKISDQKISILEQSAKLKDEKEKMDIKLTEVSNESFKKYSELEKRNKLILANAGNGLHINAVCSGSSSGESGKAKDSTSTGLDDGKTSVAIIDPKDGRSIIEITNEGDKYKTQLEALQDWVNVLIQENNK